MLKALSVYQPWGWAFFHAGKDIENRGWIVGPGRKRPYSFKHRGELAIHASAGCPVGRFVSACTFMQDRGLIHQNIETVGGVMRPVLWPPDPRRIARRAILGIVDVVDVVADSDSPWFVGPFGLVVTNPRICQFPVACSGQQGLWEVPVDLEDAVRAGMRPCPVRRAP